MINAVAVVQEFYRAMGAGDGARSRSPSPSQSTRHQVGMFTIPSLMWRGPLEILQAESSISLTIAVPPSW
jgi:hypothetical protein